MTVVALIAATLLLAVTACNKAPARPREHVVIGAGTLPVSAVVFVAQDRGFFKEEGLDATVTPYITGALALSDAVIGKLDFAATAETPMARAALEAEPFTIIATVAEVDRANYIVARKDRGIRTSDDLAGKRLGYVTGTSGDYFQNIYLATSLVDSRAVKKVELDPQDLVDALLTGRVDAVSTWPPFTTSLEKDLGANAVVLDEPGLYVMSWNIARSDVRGPSLAAQRAFLRALLKAQQYLQEHPAESMRITARWTGMDVKTLRALWPDLRWNLGLDQSLLISLEDEAAWMASHKSSSGPQPDFLRYIDTKPLRAVRPSEVNIVEPAD